MALCDMEGREVAGAGNVEDFATLQTAARPFQLLPLVERGHAGRLGL